MCDGVMTWSFTFSSVKFNSGDEFLRINVSYKRVIIVFVMDTVIYGVEGCENEWVSLYKLIDFPDVCVVEILHSIPECPSTDSVKRSALSVLVLAVLLSSLSVG